MYSNTLKKYYRNDDQLCKINCYFLIIRDYGCFYPEKPKNKYYKPISFQKLKKTLKINKIN